MRFTTWTFDPAGLVFLVLVILLMAGVIGFTPVWVGAILLMSQIKLPITWNL